MITEEMRIAERHRRYQIHSAQRRIERLHDHALDADEYGWENMSSEAGMRLALHSLMIGSHAHRGTPV